MNCYLPWIVAFPPLGGGLCELTHEQMLPFGLLPLETYLTALAVTLVSETLILSFFFREAVSAKQIFRFGLIANIATHPLAVFGWLPLATQHIPLRDALLAAELVIPLIEAAVIYKLSSGGHLSWRRITTASVVANFFSWTLGALL